jgi:hypothetical protein
MGKYQDAPLQKGSGVYEMRLLLSYEKVISVNKTIPIRLLEPKMFRTASTLLSVILFSTGLSSIITNSRLEDGRIMAWYADYYFMVVGNLLLELGVGQQILKAAAT